MPNESEKFFSEWSERMGAVKSENQDIGKAFGAFFAALMKEGALSVKEKELVALGIGLAVRCLPCINLHVEKCLQAGATREQILEVAGVAVMMQGGPTFTYVPHVVEALNAVRDKK